MVIKLTAGITPIHSILHREFPHLKQFFNARHPLPSAKSHLHVIFSPFFRAIVDHQWKDTWAPILPFDYESEKLRELKRRRMSEDLPPMKTIARDCAYVYGGALDFYLRHRDVYECCVLFEDLMEDLEGETRRLFGALGIPGDQVPAALTAVEEHSQGHIFGDPKRATHYEWKEEYSIDTDLAFEEIGVPVRTDMTAEEFKALFR